MSLFFTVMLTLLASVFSVPSEPPTLRFTPVPVIDALPTFFATRTFALLPFTLSAVAEGSETVTPVPVIVTLPHAPFSRYVPNERESFTLPRLQSMAVALAATGAAGAGSAAALVARATEPGIPREAAMASADRRRDTRVTEGSRGWRRRLPDRTQRPSLCPVEP